MSVAIDLTAFERVSFGADSFVYASADISAAAACSGSGSASISFFGAASGSGASSVSSLGIDVDLAFDRRIPKPGRAQPRCVSRNASRS